MTDATKGAGGGMSDCRHPSIAAWQIDGTGESAGLWSCRECGHKFVPIAQLLAAADELERLRGVKRLEGYLLDLPTNLRKQELWNVIEHVRREVHELSALPGEKG